MALKYTTEDMKKLFVKGGCELLDEYKGSGISMKYRCKCGNISSMRFGDFKKGKRCANCAKQGLCKKRSLEDVQKMFKERGCEFLDDEFKGIHHKHRYRCSCGKEAEIAFAGFHHQNQLCRECGLNKNKGKKHHMWIKDREEKKLKDKFRKKCYKALQSSLDAVGREKVGRTSDMLGYGPKELREHIEQHPNWDNVKDGSWHLDHIFPIEAFVEHNIKDIRLINSLSNLQPLGQKENNEKSSKYDKKLFSEWLKSMA
jgi:hypothetical protein